MSCPICTKRSAKRFCPAKGEWICAVCCGTEREVSIDCPSDCPFLLAARRYEAEHRAPVLSAEVPYPDVRVSGDLVHEQRPVVSGLSFTIVKAAADDRALDDSDVLAAVGALAETFRTLGSGIYYEKPPESPRRAGLYTRLGEFLQEYRKQESERTGISVLKDTEIFHLLIFLLRVGRHYINGRPKSRAFLDFLRGQFPKLPELAAEQPRIIAP